MTLEEYARLFPDDNVKYESVDKQQLEERRLCHLYILGDPDRPVPNGKSSSEYYQFFEKDIRRMHTPVRVDTKEGPILDVSVKRDRVEVLNENGVVMCSAHSGLFGKKAPENMSLSSIYQMKKCRFVPSPEPHNFKKGRSEKRRVAFVNKLHRRRGQLDVKEEEITQMMRDDGCYDSSEDGFDEYELDSDEESDEEIVEFINEDDPAPVPALSAEFMEISDKFFNSPPSEPRFVHFGSGYGFRDVAIDGQGILWMYLHDDKSLFPFLLVEKATGKLVTEKVLRVQITSDCYAFLVEGRGIIFYNEKVKFLPSMVRTYEPNGSRAGFPCFDDHLCFIEVDSVPDTASVRDFSLIGERGVAYLKEDGTVGWGTFGYGVCEIERKIADLNSRGPFTCVSGSHSSICLAKKGTGVVTFGYRSVLGTDELDLCLQTYLESDHIVSVAAGSYYFLFLSEAGDVYSLGEEHQINGCLGLGTLQRARQMKHVKLSKKRTIYTLVASQPIKINLPGKAYGVFADDTISGVLVYEKPNLHSKRRHEEVE